MKGHIDDDNPYCHGSSLMSEHIIRQPCQVPQCSNVNKKLRRIDGYYRAHYENWNVASFIAAKEAGDANFLLKCRTCFTLVCDQCVETRTNSQECLCPQCERNICVLGYTKLTKQYFTPIFRTTMWTLLLIRNRWKTQGHPMATFPVTFWLLHFNKYLL
jgi:hypothetical protein